MRDTLPGLLVALPLAGAAAVPLFAACFRRSARRLAMAIHLATAAIAVGLYATVAAGGPIRYAVGGWRGPWGIELWLDGLSLLIAVLVAGMACFAASAQTAYGGPGRPGTAATPLGEGLLRGAMLLLVAGLLGMAATRDVFNLFVFMEISSLAAYTLVAAGGARATVAAFRYLLAGTAAGSLYLLGVGFLYALTGTLNMDDLAARIPAVEAAGAVTVGVCLIAVGLSIKAALFPLHGWLPDSYVFAPVPAAGFIAAVMAKVSAYALLRLLSETLAATEAGAVVVEVLLWLGILGVLAGGVFALAQREIPRMLAWSSVAAMGTVLLGVAIGTELAITGVLFHILAHAFAKGCLFFGAGNRRPDPGDTGRAGWTGLGARAPWVAAALSVAAGSMIGLPPTAGFFSKYFLLAASLEAGGVGGVAAFIALLASSLLSAIYFLRVLEAVWFRPSPQPATADPGARAPATGIRLPGSLAAPVIGLAALVLLTGIFAGPVREHLLPDWTPGAAAATRSLPESPR